MLSSCVTLQPAEKNFSEQQNPGTQTNFMPRISPPPLQPAPHLIKRFNVSPKPHQNDSLPPLNESIPWANLYCKQEDKIKLLEQLLADYNCEIQCLKSTVVTANGVILEKEDEIKQLQGKVNHFEATSNRLQLELAESNAIGEKQREELKQLKMSIAESTENQELLQAKTVAFQLVINRLRAESESAGGTRGKQSVESNHSADQVDEMPMKKRRKMHHKCLNCGYSTIKAYHMRIHRQEGCQSAVVTKNYSCTVCETKFTYNTLRYHLNQYTKQSSHAQNGHQKYTPEQHREMLRKLKQTKH